MIRKNLILFITNILCLCMISSAYDFTNWQYRGTVKINTTNIIQNNVTNFPLLIRLNTSNFDFSQAQSGGIDIMLADDADNLLPFVLDKIRIQKQCMSLKMKKIVKIKDFPKLLTNFVCNCQ